MQGEKHYKDNLRSAIIFLKVIFISIETNKGVDQLKWMKIIMMIMIDNDEWKRETLRDIKF